MDKYTDKQKDRLSGEDRLRLADSYWQMNKHTWKCMYRELDGQRERLNIDLYRDRQINDLTN